jgi:hypothetical protein
MGLAGHILRVVLIDEGKRTRIRVGEAGDNIKMDLKYGGVCVVN